MPTTENYVEALAHRVGICETGTTSITPDYTTDADAARLIASAALYDSEGQPSKFTSCFAYLLSAAPQVARCASDGFSLMELTVFTPPGSGTYTLTMNGYGATGSLVWSDTAATIQAAIRLVAGFEDAEVTTVGSDRLIDLGTVNPVDITASAGTIVSRGLGRVRLNHALTSVLASGAPYTITGFLPWTDYDGWRGLRSWINDALAQTPFVYRVPLTATDTGRINVFDLSAEIDWLKKRKQVIGLYSAGLYDFSASFTPPGSGSYTLEMTLGPTTYTTASLAFGASASAIQAALQAVTAETGVTVTATGSSPVTVAAASSRLWPIALAASSGTVGTQTVTEVQEPTLLGPGGAFSYRNGYPVFECDPFPSTKETRFLACYRRASTWIAPQTDYQTPSPDAGYAHGFAASTTGLVGPSDRAMPETEQVAHCAYALVCEYLFDKTKDTAWRDKMQRVGQAALWANIFDSQEDRNPGRAANGIGFSGWQKLTSGGLSYR